MSIGGSQDCANADDHFNVRIQERRCLFGICSWHNLTTQERADSNNYSQTLTFTGVTPVNSSNLLRLRFDNSLAGLTTHTGYASVS